eukprot:139548-Prymnesium_polylepis.1
MAVRAIPAIGAAEGRTRSRRSAATAAYRRSKTAHPALKYLRRVMGHVAPVVSGALGTRTTSAGCR